MTITVNPTLRGAELWRRIADLYPEGAITIPEQYR